MATCLLILRLNGVKCAFKAETTVYPLLAFERAHDSHSFVKKRSFPKALVRILKPCLLPKVLGFLVWSLRVSNGALNPPPSCSFFFFFHCPLCQNIHLPGRGEEEETTHCLSKESSWRNGSFLQIKT